MGMGGDGEDFVEQRGQPAFAQTGVWRRAKFEPLAAALRNTALGEGRRGEFHEQVGLRCPVIRIGIVRQRYISRKV